KDASIKDRQVGLVGIMLVSLCNACLGRLLFNWPRFRRSSFGVEDLVDTDAYADTRHWRRGRVIGLVGGQPVIDSLEQCLTFNGEERFEFRQWLALNSETQGAPLEARAFRGLSHEVMLESRADILEHAPPDADLVVGELTRNVVALQHAQASVGQFLN